MSLLQEIQSAAVDGTTDPETLLRKCRVLAARLKHDDFKNWIYNELDGYNSDTELPDYRKFHVQCFGHFSGPFQSGLKNAPIPESCIPQELRKRLTRVEMRDGIGALKDLIDSCKGGTITYGWPADANAFFGHQIYERMVLMQGW